MTSLYTIFNLSPFYLILALKPLLQNRTFHCRVLPNLNFVQIKNNNDIKVLMLMLMLMLIMLIITVTIIIIVIIKIIIIIL